MAMRQKSPNFYGVLGEAGPGFLAMPKIDISAELLQFNGSIYEFNSFNNQSLYKTTKLTWSG